MKIGDPGPLPSEVAFLPSGLQPRAASLASRPSGGDPTRPIPPPAPLPRAKPLPDEPPHPRVPRFQPERSREPGAWPAASLPAAPRGSPGTPLPPLAGARAALGGLRAAPRALRCGLTPRGRRRGCCLLRRPVSGRGGSSRAGGPGGGAEPHQLGVTAPDPQAAAPTPRAPPHPPTPGPAGTTASAL